MTSSNLSVKTSSFNGDSISISTRLRRLKIQEHLLLQNFINVSHDDKTLFKHCFDYKKFIINLRNSYIDIKNLFYDVQNATKTDDILKSVDLDDVKRDVLELDEKIKLLKTFLQSEQLSLQEEEQKLITELNDIKVPNCKNKMQRRMSSKTFSDIVPSPVKTLIKSPHKCQEVQQLQDFLTSTNKFGGWNEYNHNIFTKLWQKYFENEKDITDLKYEENTLFIAELLHSVPGIKRPDIISHMKWYWKYLYLKQRQQNALEEWKNRNRALKAPYRLDPMNLTPTKKNLRKFKTCPPRTNEKEFYNDKEDKNNLNVETNISYRYAKPTQQWEIKCKELKENTVQIQDSNIENVRKRGIPHWRIGLQSIDNQ